MKNSQIHADIINASDFRLPGGTSHSVAEEVTAQSRLGLRTILAQVDSNIHQRAHPWASKILDLVTFDLASIATPFDQIRAKLLIFRHPSIVEEGFFPYDVEVDQVIMVANHVANNARGLPTYDVATVNETLYQRFKMTPIWYPISTIVRDSLKPFEDTIKIADSDWENIFSDTSSKVITKQPNPKRPIVGRHSRNQISKWPEEADTLNAVYPNDGNFDVRILGGADPAKRLFGAVPENWTVYPFGQLPAERFLQEIDFWVYFHHSTLREAYGRATMEALLAGAVVILPHYMKVLFGDAALYAEPNEVQTLILKYSRNVDLYQRQSQRGQEFVRKFDGALHASRLMSLGVTPQKPDRRATTPVTTVESKAKPRVMFITSNGAGMGHLTRLLSIARNGDAHFDSVFVSLSAAAPVVGQYGIPFEYVPSGGALGAPYQKWNPYLTDRLRGLVKTYSPQAIVFDGTSPYGGLQRVLREVSALRIWVRRGMWKPETKADVLSRAADFDLVIEPGDYAFDYDRGPTRGIAKPLEPIVLVSDFEQLQRPEAQEYLGIMSGERAVLITLGAGNINTIDEAQQVSIREFAKRGWRVFVTHAPISTQRYSFSSTQASVLRYYPLARLAKAFDAVVSACGYNSYHEWLAAGVPAIWVPNLDTSVDDQAARARYAQDNKLGIYVDPCDSSAKLVEAIMLMDDNHYRASMQRRLERLPRPVGGYSAALQISSQLSRMEEL